MSEDPQRAKWDARHREAALLPPVAAVLADNVHLLPPRGEALDLACGLGSNALLLAERGLGTHAWDFSPVAIARLRALAGDKGLSIQAAVRDVVAQPPPPAAFDIIVVSHFLERALCPALVAALRPGGLLFYQTFSGPPGERAGPANPAFRLTEGELLRLFAPLRPVVYREEGDLGDRSKGLRGEAMLIGLKGHDTRCKIQGR